MREIVLQYIRQRKLMKAGDRVGVAVSGGADSVALLRVLLELRDELGVVLFVAHFNHQMRGKESDADERFVAELARRVGLELFLGSGDVRDHAKRENLGIEEAARDLRYRWLTLIGAMQKLDCVAIAHTLDDQAETVLMKFLRGAGTRGLAGIYPEMLRGDTKKIRFIRPLLATSRAQIEDYLCRLNQPWREDHSNRNTQHTRNRIRHELLPLLQRDYNSNIRQLLQEAAEVARGEEDFWELLVGLERVDRHTQPRSLLLKGFDCLHVTLQRRVLKDFLEREGLAADFHHVEDLRRCAVGAASRANLAGGCLAVRNRECLTVTKPESSSTNGYEYTLDIPGGVVIAEIADIGATVLASLLDPDTAAKADPGTLLDASAVGRQLTIRNWLPGDRFRPAHSSAGKKLKELFGEKKIPAEKRPTWPVVLYGDQIVWVRGFPVAHDFAWQPGAGDAIQIEVLPLQSPHRAT